MSRSKEMADHLQSYFLVLEKKAFTSAAFEGFWDQFLFYRSKRRIIQEYELGLSRLSHHQGWKSGAWVETESLLDRGLNLTLFSWDALIEKKRFPFLKTEVLRLNRARSPNISAWHELIQDHSKYPVVLIQNHLRRVQQTSVISRV
jgi:lipopolysaccharide biosynthesis protein